VGGALRELAGAREVSGCPTTTAAAPDVTGNPFAQAPVNAAQPLELLKDSWLVAAAR
jgi:hypothetical protein